MQLHIVMMAFHQAVSPELRQRMEQCFNTIRTQCQGVLRFELVDNQSHTSADYTHALLSVFTSEQALQDYREGAAHAQMLEVLGPHIARIVVLDSALESERAL